MQLGLAPPGAAWTARAGALAERDLMTDPDAAAGLAWKRMKGLLPAIVQDDESGRLLGVGLMDKAALERTLQSGLVVFHELASRPLLRARHRLPSELRLRAIFPSCDAAALLLLVEKKSNEASLPMSGFEVPARGPGWLAELARMMADSANPQRPAPHFDLQRLAQEFGEQSVDVAIAGLCRDSESCVREIARLLLFLATLIEARGLEWGEIISDLQRQYGARCKQTKSPAHDA